MDRTAWESIVQSALQQGVQMSNGPVPGARLRQLIAEHAEAAQLEFPPDANQSFGKFLDQFGSVLLAQKRPGRDMLVVPADNVALLSSPDVSASSVRNDLFEAFTIIPKAGERGPMYLPDTDKVIWPDAGMELPGNVKPLHTATLEEAISDRKEFAARASSQEARIALDQSLQGSKPLRAFSEAVRAHGIARSWHQYRLGKVLERLKDWSQKSGIPWRAAWLSQDEQPSVNALSTVSSSQDATNVQDFFLALGSVLKDGDLARINIPLDLVARAWASRG